MKFCGLESEVPPLLAFTGEGDSFVWTDSAAIGLTALDGMVITFDGPNNRVKLEP